MESCELIKKLFVSEISRNIKNLDLRIDRAKLMGRKEVTTRNLYTTKLGFNSDECLENALELRNHLINHYCRLGYQCYSQESIPTLVNDIRFTIHWK